MAPNETLPFHVFLAHNSTEKPAVRELKHRLEQRGLKVWLDEAEVMPGRPWLPSLDFGIRASGSVAVLVGRDGLGGWADEETQAALIHAKQTNRPVIPVLLPGASAVELPLFLQRLALVDMRGGMSDETITQLVWGITGPRPSAGFTTPLITHPPDCVRPLQVAEDRYLQVLLSEFTIVRRPETSGFKLLVSFDDDTPAIWDQAGKRHLRGLMSSGKRQEYQESLQAFFLADAHRPGDSYDFKDPSFWFRYASGGTLLTVCFEGDATSYYCLPYRDIHPIGWNITNGGSDNHAELLEPRETIARELREEVIVADFGRGVRYVFAADSGKAIDHPVHAVARRLWTEHCPHKDLTSLAEATIDVEWFAGPDSLQVRHAGETTVRKGFYLNINAEDFGIEFDQVAKIVLPREAVFFDGEIDGGNIVNTPVGFFEVGRFQEALRAEETSFRPDFFFFDAVRRKQSELDHILENEFLEHLKKFRTPAEIEEFRKQVDAKKQYGLCPVTDRIARRVLRTPPVPG
jgi:hypothetical protein